MTLQDFGNLIKYICKTFETDVIDLTNLDNEHLIHFVNTQTNEVWGDVPTEIRMNTDGDWFIYFEDTDCIVYEDDLEINADNVWNELSCELFDIFNLSFEQHKFKIGDKVYWNDPAIDDYPDEEREMALNRRFVIVGIDGDYDDAIIHITDCYTDAEVLPNELTKI